MGLWHIAPHVSAGSRLDGARGAASDRWGAALSALRVVVIGAGYFSRFHYDAWARLPEAEVVGICDRDLAKALEVAERFPEARVADDAARLLDETACDLVDIVT